MYYRLTRSSSSCKDSMKVLEEDVQRANALAAAIPRAKHGSYLQMKLVYNHLAPLFLFLMQWVDCSCTCILPRYLNFFHILIYKVYTDGRPNISAHGRKATRRPITASRMTSAATMGTTTTTAVAVIATTTTAALLMRMRLLMKKRPKPSLTTKQLMVSNEGSLKLMML